METVPRPGVPDPGFGTYQKNDRDNWFGLRQSQQPQVLSPGSPGSRSRMRSEPRLAIPIVVEGPCEFKKVKKENKRKQDLKLIALELIS